MSLTIPVIEGDVLRLFLSLSLSHSRAHAHTHSLHCPTKKDMAAPSQVYKTEGHLAETGDTWQSGSNTPASAHLTC